MKWGDYPGIFRCGDRVAASAGGEDQEFMGKQAIYGVILGRGEAGSKRLYLPTQF